LIRYIPVTQFIGVAAIRGHVEEPVALQIVWVSALHAFDIFGIQFSLLNLRKKLHELALAIEPQKPIVLGFEAGFSGIGWVGAQP
jgi:hypothetical protein